MAKQIFIGILIFCFLFGASASFAEKPELSKETTVRLSSLEDSLVLMVDSMEYSIPDYRMDYCVKFTKYLREVLDIPNSFEYPFAKLSDRIHIIYPEDKTFRIFNWLIAPSNGVRRYYGAVQMDAEEPKYYPLIDGSDELKANAETKILDNKHWYGCEIYKIMDQNIDGQKAYLLFGFNSNGMLSNKKILDVLSFNESGVTFGAPIFTMPNVKGQLVQQNRVILEYKKTSSIYFNYDNDRKMIIFNRLASEVTDPNRKNTYIPTGQMDGLRWENGMYQFVKEAVPVLKLQDGQAPIDGVMK